MTDLNGWNDAAVPDWSNITVRSGFADDAKDMPLSWAQDMLCRWHQRDPDGFNREVGRTAVRWHADKFGEASK